jgi:hypothetical protein
MSHQTIDTLAFSLSRSFLTSSRWRDRQASLYAHDYSRNANAANRLRELASQIAISDYDWNRIKPHFSNGADARWLSAVSDTNREVGFRRQPRDFSEYFDNLVANLAVNSVAA